MDQISFQNETPSVAIILVNWNGYEVTNNCIQSLKKINYRNYKIILVDNASADGSGKKLRSDHPDIVTLLSDQNLGFTGGNNVGFRYSLENNFDYSMMLNNDTLVEPDFLTRLVNAAESAKDIGAVQPRIQYNHDRSLLWNGGSYYNAAFGFTYTKGENRKASTSYVINKKVDWITGCAFLVKNKVLQLTGLLAENMFMYSEDVDLSFRIRKNGYRLQYEGAAIIYHIVGHSTKPKKKDKEGYMPPFVHYLNQRNRIWILKKHADWYWLPSIIAANSLYILLIMLYFVIRRRTKKLKSMARAVIDGLTGNIDYQVSAKPFHVQRY